MCTAGLLPSRGRPCYQHFADTAVSAPAAVAERGGIGKKKSHAHPTTQNTSSAGNFFRLFSPGHSTHGKFPFTKASLGELSHKTLLHSLKWRSDSLLLGVTWPRHSRARHENERHSTPTHTQEERDECSPPSRAPESKLRCGGSAARGAVVAAPAA